MAAEIIRPRIATLADVPGMHVVRRAVRENRLTTGRITEASYAPEIGQTGRGWVVEREGAIAGFAVGNVVTGNIWALFVHPDHEGHGVGRALHDVMVAWLFDQGLTRLAGHQRRDPALAVRFETAGIDQDVGDRTHPPAPVLTIAGQARQIGNQRLTTAREAVEQS